MSTAPSNCCARTSAATTHWTSDRRPGAGRRSVDGGFVLMTSRASYEIVQKAAAVGIAVVAAVSAPTGMAVRVAQDSGVTLIGFARGERHCVYSHPQRIH
jgi:phenylacetyl-CoA:acceptor oxidoreductase accessory protein